MNNHVRSASVLNFKNSSKNQTSKNKLYDNQYGNKNLPIPHSQVGQKGYKKLSRVNSASRVLNHSSSDFNINKNQAKNIDKNNQFNINLSNNKPF